MKNKCINTLIHWRNSVTAAIASLLIAQIASLFPAGWRRNDGCKKESYSTDLQVASCCFEQEQDSSPLISISSFGSRPKNLSGLKVRVEGIRRSGSGLEKKFSILHFFVGGHTGTISLPCCQNAQIQRMAISCLVLGQPDLQTGLDCCFCCPPNLKDGLPEILIQYSQNNTVAFAVTHKEEVIAYSRLQLS